MSTLPKRSASGDERRLAPRRRTLKTGLAIYGGYLFRLECSVRDLSKEGARLRFGRGSGVPDRFALLLSADGIVHEALVVRRTGDEVAVVFDGPATPINDADPRVKRFHFR